MSDVSTLQANIARLVRTCAGLSPTGRRWRHVDGSYRVLESAATNLLTTMSVAGLVVHARDVTERNLAEDQVRALNSELETRVIERTAALARRAFPAGHRLGRRDRSSRSTRQRRRSRVGQALSPERSHSSAGEGERTFPGIYRSPGTVVKLSLLFSMDSFAGGLTVQSLVAY